MQQLFERQNSLNDPVECFVFDATEENFPVKPHWHYFAEFLYMLKGSAEINSDEQTYILNEGELMILHPSAVHSITAAGETLPVYAVLKFDLRKFPSNSSYSPPPADIFKFARTKDMPILFGKSRADAIRCGEIFGDCVEEIKSYRFGFGTMLRSHIYRLIFGIVREWIEDGLVIGDCPVSGDTYGIENITEYIDAHLDEGLKVRDVAARCHLSYSGFAARFHRLYGMSCKEYIERMRIFKAEEYLLFTDLDLSYVSQQTGFSDCSHFIRSFKKLRGITPKQYRLQRKK